MYWQLYDYFFAPNGAFYGTKKACEVLHIQYSYDDGSIRVVNTSYNKFSGLKAIAKLYDFNLDEIYSQETNTDINEDESKKVLFPSMPKDSGDIFFLKLYLKDSGEKEISSNFYWISPRGDANADFTALNKLSQVKLNTSVSPIKSENGKSTAIVEIENTSSSLAFSINPVIIKRNSGEMVLPVFWEDNYFTLLPKERRKIKVGFRTEDLNLEIPVLKLGGWNIKREEIEIR